MSEDFASLMNAGGGDRAARQVRKGETVKGTVVAIAADTVFIDIGAVADARVPREDCVDASGRLTVSVGSTLVGVVTEGDHGEGAVVSLAVGRAKADTESLETALSAGLPVEGRVTGVNKGGIEVDVGGMRCFCPASHVDVARVDDLGALIGQTLRFKVVEIKDERSIVLSRREVLEEERRAQGQRRLETLRVGADVDGIVTAVQRYGAFVDIDGIEGLLHISELAARRVDSVEDVVSPGDRVRVRVLSIEPSKDGSIRVSLSLKALSAEDAPPAPRPDEVLPARVVEHKPNGVVVETAKGSGFLHVRDLDLPPRGDHRRAYPADAVIKVVVNPGAGRGGRLAFSMKGVAAVEERANVAEHAARASGRGKKQLGTFGALLAEKLGVTPSASFDEPEPAAIRSPALPAPSRAVSPASPAPSPAVSPAAPAPAPPSDGATMNDLVGRPADARKSSQRRPDPPGVIRRKR